MIMPIKDATMLVRVIAARIAGARARFAQDLPDAADDELKDALGLCDRITGWKQPASLAAQEALELDAREDMKAQQAEAAHHTKAWKEGRIKDA